MSKKDARRLQISDESQKAAEGILDETRAVLESLKQKEQAMEQLKNDVAKTHEKIQKLEGTLQSMHSLISQMPGEAAMPQQEGVAGVSAEEFARMQEAVSSLGRTGEKLNSQIEEIMTQLLDVGKQGEAAAPAGGADKGYEQLNGRLEELGKMFGELVQKARDMDAGYQQSFESIGSQVSSLSEKISAISAIREDLKKGSSGGEMPATGAAGAVETTAKLIRFIEEKVGALPAPGFGESFMEKLLEEAGKSDISYSMDSLLDLMMAQQANILHIQKESAPLVKVEGELIPVGDKLLTETDCASLILPMLSPEQRRHLANRDDIVFTTIYNNATFKINTFIQRKSIGATVKMLPMEIPTFDSLMLPDDFKSLFGFTNGLVLISGLFGSGKTSTAAALINHYNNTQKYYMITLENPIEFVHHKDRLSLITQREWGTDFFSFSSAMSQSLAKDPDVIYLGELTDPEMLMSALIAADSGRLIVSTLLSPDAIRTVERIIETFTGEAKRHVQRLLARVLRLVVSTRLADSEMGGRIPVTEVLVNTPDIARLIQENRLVEIYLHMERGAERGMITFAQSLEKLKESGTISQQEYGKHIESLGFQPSTISA